VSETIPHLPVGFSSTTSGDAHTLRHHWNRQFGLLTALAIAAAGLVHVVEHGRVAAPLAMALGATAFAVFSLPLLVNTTRFSFRRGFFVVEVRPLRVRRDRVFPVTDIADFAHRHPKDGERIDLVMDLCSGESVTLHQGVVDEEAARTLCAWLRASRMAVLAGPRAIAPTAPLPTS
jgi:hypothetical protein